MYKLKNTKSKDTKTKSACTINTSKYVKTHKQQNINQIKLILNDMYNEQPKHWRDF